MIPIYGIQILPQNFQAVNADGTLQNNFFYLIRQLINRGGGQSGIISTAGSNLTATGTTQATALMLSNDYNEVLNGSGKGVLLSALQPAQMQIVYNGTGGNVSVYPNGVGQINALGNSTAFTLGTGKTQFFVAAETQTNGGTLYRTVTLG
jgi:hypothetical protein